MARSVTGVRCHANTTTVNQREGGTVVTVGLEHWQCRGVVPSGGFVPCTLSECGMQPQ
jgi:hypothetical protein